MSSAVSKNERLIRGVLLSSATVVTVVALGIGYQQQTAGVVVQGVLALPMEEGVMPSEDMVKVDEAAGQTEPTVWCCNSDVELCYEQAAANGCGKDAQSDDFETCDSACKS